MSSVESAPRARVNAWTSLWIVGLLALASASEPRAQQEPPPAADLINWAFASQLGSGIYKVGDQTVQVYRIPISFRILRPNEKRKWGLRLRLPVTFGFFDFNLDDILKGKLPERVQTITFLPGLQFEKLVKENWWIKPYAEFGVGKDLGSGETRYIYGAGVRSQVRFPRETIEYRLRNTLSYAGNTASKAIFEERFGSFETAFEGILPFWFKLKGRQADYGPYAKNIVYFDPLVFLTPEGNLLEVRVQWEVGLTVGTTPRYRLFGKLALPRIGLGYRFGDGLEAVRLVLRSPFFPDPRPEKKKGRKKRKKKKRAD